MARVVVISSCITAAAGAAVGVFLFLRPRSKESRHVAASPSLNRSASMFYSALKTIKLTNNKGMSVHLTPVGATIQRLFVPDKSGKLQDVVLGFEEASSYATANPTPYFGALVGRVANRIANATFTLAEDGPDAQPYRLLANDGKNALHGGALGLHKRRWQTQQHSSGTHHVVAFSYTSPTGEEGYPGELHIIATYRLAIHSNELSLTIRANTTDPTPVNIAQHSYFNLAGHSKGTVLDHVLSMPEADHYTPVDGAGIPTGTIAPVAGTPMDFTKPKAIGERIDQVPGGYDHNWVLCKMGPKAKALTNNGVASAKPRLAATVYHPGSGRAMDVSTTAPGVQFYSGNFLDGSQHGKGGVAYQKHAGLCLETQGFPDALHRDNFPSIVLKPEDTYTHDMVWRFYTK